MRKAIKRASGKLTARQATELKALQAMPEKQIDYSDASSAKPEEWRGATVGKFYRPIKQQLTLRIDADVVDWFKNQGRGYQTRINELLRDVMMKEVKH